MVVIPAGSFDMGSPSGEADRDDDEGPRHQVSIRSFAAGKYEITRGQFAVFVAASGHNAGNECVTASYEGGKAENRSGRNWQNPGYSQADNHPAVCVNWDDVKAYVAWLSRKTGKNYRLLSEAEWEYAARAGTTTARYWGESPDQACSYANVIDATGNSQGSGVTWKVHKCTDGHAYTAPVGSFKPNAFGLYDMIGNVFERTEDCWNGSYSGAPTDGSAWTDGECGRRVVRGGSWYSSPLVARSAKRLKFDSTYRINYYGFRVARTLP
jgi:formylglycine-generating enzyme required for sulfatase activity